MENEIFTATRKIVEVLQDIQFELKAPKSQRNDFGKYNYRNCEDILEALKPILKKHTACVVIKDEIIIVGDRTYVKAKATLLYNGSEISTEAFAREPQERKGMDASQITGATSSYARKYALNGLFLIDDNKDADSTNNHASSYEQSASVETISNKQLGVLRDLLISIGEEGKESAFAKFLKVDSLEHLPVCDFNKAMALLVARKDKKELVGAK
jgi:hypothetical protein